MVLGETGFWTGLALLIPLFLSAAKTHGRQIRIERELEGHREVDFRRDDNPPWVEELWKKDQARYWTFAAIALFLFLIAGAAFVARGAESHGPIWAWGIIALLGAMVVAFAASGLLSWVRFRQAVQKRVASPNPPDDRWLKQTSLGTMGWWLLTMALLAAVVVLLLP